MVIIPLLCSCYTKQLEVTGIAYQSFRNTIGNKSLNDVTDKSKIIVMCNVDLKGNVDVLVTNNSDEIMTIDRTKTFFRDATGKSTAYYDPTIQTTTSTQTRGKNGGVSVNAGAVAGALGVGGALGSILNGVNVSGGTNSAVSTSNTTYTIDQPKAQIAPHSTANLGRVFFLDGIGISTLASAIQQANGSVFKTFTPEDTYTKCYVCVTYSVDEEKSYQKFETEIYANTLFVSKVENHGQVNEALRQIYSNKSDCFNEPWYVLHFLSNRKENNTKSQFNTIINY